MFPEAVVLAYQLWKIALLKVLVIMKNSQITWLAKECELLDALSHLDTELNRIATTASQQLDKPYKMLPKTKRADILQTFVGWHQKTQDFSHQLEQVKAAFLLSKESYGGNAPTFDELAEMEQDEIEQILKNYQEGDIEIVNLTTAVNGLMAEWNELNLDEELDQIINTIYAKQVEPSK